MMARFGPPLTKLSGSAHVLLSQLRSIRTNVQNEVVLVPLTCDDGVKSDFKDIYLCPIEIINRLTDKGQFQYLTKIKGAS